MNFVRTWCYYLLYPFARVLLFVMHPFSHFCGRNNIPEGAYILCSNHCRWDDPLWLLAAIRPKRVFRFMAKAELAKVPLLGAAIRAFGVIFVRRGMHDTAAVEAAMQAVRAGDQIMIFPEGTRVKKGRHVPAKTGAIRIAQACGAPILPVYMSQERTLFRPIRVVIGEVYLPKCDPNGEPHEELRRCAEKLKTIIYDLGGTT